MNSPLRILLADDEKLARRELKRLLKGADDVEVIGEASNGLEALSMIRELRPDMVFLDIEMPGLSGIELVEKLMEKGPDVNVVMVTAYDHYAVKAFDVKAVDYVLKPVEQERLLESVRRVREKIESGERSAGIERLLEALRSGDRKKLSLRSDESTLIIDADDLVFAYFEEGSVVGVTTGATGTLNYKSLDDLHAALGSGFVRAHRKYLVNLDMIREVIPWFSGSYRLRLKNKSEIPLSRRHAKELREILKF